MECSVCLEEYTEGIRQPKVLPCGHSACLCCLKQVPSCPRCRHPFKGPAEQLLTNFDLLRSGAQDADDWWCTECGAQAELCCRRRHPIIHVGAALRQHAEDLTPRASEVVQGLAEAVRSATGEPARAALQLLAGPSGPQGPRAPRAPHAPHVDCDLGLRQGDAAFTARFGLADEGAVGVLARALLCALAKEGRIAKDDHKNMSGFQGSHDMQDQQLDPQTIVKQENQEDQQDDQDVHEGTEEPEPEEEEPDDVIQVLDVTDLSESEPMQRLVEKEEVLSRVRRFGVKRLKRVQCSKDPTWSLELLQASPARLQELYVLHPREEHLRAMHQACSIRRLAILCAGDRALLDTRPPDLPVPTKPSCLKWLCVVDLPRARLRSLLFVHGASLETLWLFVGTPGQGRWPRRGNNLDGLLDGRGLPALRRVILGRQGVAHTPAPCLRQRTAVRLTLPDAAVLCNQCDRIPLEQF